MHPRRRHRHRGRRSRNESREGVGGDDDDGCAYCVHVFMLNVAYDTLHDKCY